MPYGTPIVVGDFTVFVYPADQQNAAALAAQHPRTNQQSRAEPVNDTRQRMGGSPSQGATLPPRRAAAHAERAGGTGAPQMPAACSANGMMARTGTGARTARPAQSRW